MIAFRTQDSSRRSLLPILIAMLCACSGDQSGTSADDVAEAGTETPRAMGLTVRADGVAPGYVLYSPLWSGTTFLLDDDGQAVHTWDSDYGPHSLYLLEDGRLLRPGRDPDAKGFQAGGAMGLVEMYSWEGERLWHWKLSDDQQILHHDIEPLPNGNFLANGWEVITPEQARAAGRREDLIPEEGLWSDFVVEIEPILPDDGRIVWKWRAWDHLVQNVDPDLPNYGDPADHPGRLDVNAGGPPMEIDADEMAQLEALGYVPSREEEEATEEGDTAGADVAEEAGEEAEEDEEEEVRPDFLHVNAVDWHPELDQIAMTTPELGEIWIIRRPSSTEEGAGPAGDLIYRWGNPSAWGRGPADSKRLFYPHDVRWIPEGYDDAGQLMVFNNGNERPEGEWTSLEQLAPPLQADGSYALEEERPYGPEELTWSYSAPEPESFYAAFISGAHRLPNGNTFVTSGPQGRLFEIDSGGEIVWEFWNPWAWDIRKRNKHGRRGSRPEEEILADPFMRGFIYGVWRAHKYSPDYPGLAGRDLEPLPEQKAHFVLPPLPPEEEGEGDGAEDEAAEESDTADTLETDDG